MTGRPPPTFAVLDVGGTSIKIGAARGAEAVFDGSVPASATSDRTTVIECLAAAAKRSVACARQLTDDRVSGIAIAFPGPFDLGAGRPLLTAPGKFHAIHGVDLRDELRSVTDLPIEFARDSEAVGVGEARFGAGRGVDRVLTVALGTGFGSCLTVAGTPVSRVGAQRIESLFEIPTPHGRVDDVLSASGLARSLGVETSELGAVLADQTMRESSRHELETYGHRLGTFLATLGELHAETIVVAGGLARSWDLFAAAVASRLDIPVVASQLGERSALLGAASLGFADTA